MALVLKDRVKVTTTTTGTGTLTLGAAQQGFQDFGAIGNGNSTYYTIQDPVTGDWEVGAGVYTASGTTLSRDEVLSSSNAGALVNFGAGSKIVFVTYPAEKSSISYYTEVTTTYTAGFSEGVLADTTSAAFTVTLPASPSSGAQVSISDSGGNFGINNLTVGRNGSTIGGLSEDLVLDINSVSVNLIYDGSTWLVYAQIGGNGGTAVTLDGVQTLTNKTISGSNNTLTNISLATAVTGTLPAANGGTGITSPGTSGNVLTSNGTAWTSGAPPSSAVSYPQNIQTADYTLVLGDAGKQIYHPASDANIRTFTIPSNASVAFPIGTVVLFVAENGGTQVIVAINSDTLVTTEGITGTKLVTAGNVLTCIKTTSTKWICYLANDVFTSVQQIAVAHTISPFITAYPWSGSGFGTKYTNPATLPASTGNGVAFSPDGANIAVAHVTTPFIAAYPWSGSGFGTKYANPATLPAGNGNGVAFSPDGANIAVAHATPPFIAAYPWSGSGFGTKYADPATLPTGDGRGVAFSPDGANIAVAHSTTPFITAYPWSGSGFGTKYTDPATLPPDTGRGVAFSPDGANIAVAHSTTPFITAYPWSGSGFGTKYTDPATLPASTGSGVAFSPDGANIAVAHSTTPFITAYPWSGSGFGTKYTDPATLPASTGQDVAFSPDGANIAVAHTTSPFITAYPWSGSGFGTNYTNPATLPTGTGNGVAFNSF
jgi:sugar lactone lactonase YvrE